MIRRTPDIRTRLRLGRVGTTRDLAGIVGEVPRGLERRANFAANLLAARLHVEAPVELPYDLPMASTPTQREPVKAELLAHEEAKLRWQQMERMEPGTDVLMETCWELTCRVVNRWFLAPAVTGPELAREPRSRRPRVLGTIGRQSVDAEAMNLDGYVMLYPNGKNAAFWTATGVIAMSGECEIGPERTTLWLRTARSFGPLLHELRAHTKGDDWIVDEVTATISGPPGSSREPTPAAR